MVLTGPVIDAARRDVGEPRQALRELGRCDHAARRVRLQERAQGSRVLLEVVYTQGQRHPGPRAVRVDEQREARPTHALEQQRGATRLGGAIGDRGELEVRVDRARDPHQLASRLQRLQEVPCAVEAHGYNFQIYLKGS